MYFTQFVVFAVFSDGFHCRFLKHKGYKPEDIQIQRKKGRKLDTPDHWDIKINIAV